jgi:lipoate-protein ligase A
MRLLETELSGLAENLALDEALLEGVQETGDLFRTWEVHRPAVVLGRASRRLDEVQEAFCQTEGIPVVRRCSGGASVVLMRGCLLYSVVLRLEDHPELRIIERAHAFVLERIREAIVRLGRPVELAGTSDLVLGGRKFSGNSLRCRKDGVLYHGTLLLEASIDLIGRCLKMPPRQPDYRDQRPHEEFLTNLNLSADALDASLRQAWQCEGRLEDWPRGEVERLVAERYGQESWNA